MSFHVGQLVVCVDDQEHRDWVWSGLPSGTLDGLRKGVVYTVEGADVSPSGIPVTLLCEIKRPPPPNWAHTDGYATARFRPVDETRLEIFRAALTTKPIRELEPITPLLDGGADG